MLPDDISILARSHARAVGKFARLHAAKQIEVFIEGAVAIRAVLAGRSVVPRLIRILPATGRRHSVAGTNKASAHS